MITRISVHPKSLHLGVQLVLVLDLILFSCDVGHSFAGALNIFCAVLPFFSDCTLQSVDSLVVTRFGPQFCSFVAEV